MHSSALDGNPPTEQPDHLSVARPCFSRTSIPTRPPFVIHPCGYISHCRARGCPKRGTLIAEKVDVAGRHIRQIELCARHCEVVIERERARGLEICDRPETL